MKKTLLLFLLFTLSAFGEISSLTPEMVRNDGTQVLDNTAFSHEKGLNPNNPYAGGFNELLDYVLPSPYQGGAGSCLYMSHTGVIEWWVNKLGKRTGKRMLDLSERYYMSLKTDRVGQDNIENWRTDNIQRLNEHSLMYKNSQYRFTQGYYKVVDGKRVATLESDEDAIYGMKYNWISFRDKLSKKGAIKLPKFKRIVHYADADYNQWKVAEAPKDIVKTVKDALLKYRSPVQIIYNHKGFWHANFIVGFNDNYKTDCPFTSTFKKDMNERADEIEVEADEAQTEKERNRLLKKAKKFRVRGQKVEDRYQADGACSGKGVFYVRDSIYPNKDEDLYDYDFNNEGEEEHLNAKVILREYEWLQSTANHVFQVMPK